MTPRPSPSPDAPARRPRRWRLPRRWSLGASMIAVAFVAVGLSWTRAVDQTEAVSIARRLVGADPTIRPSDLLDRNVYVTVITPRSDRPDEGYWVVTTSSIGGKFPAKTHWIEARRRPFAGPRVLDTPPN